MLLRRVTSLIGALATAALVTACASSQGASAAGGATAATVDRTGTYTFTERVPQTSPNTIVLEGTVRVTGDSAVVDMVPGPCRYALPSEQSRTTYVYQCGDVRVTVDRDDPTRVNYSLTTMVAVSRNVCVEYSAARQCLRYEVEKSEEQQRRSGRLRLVRQ